MPSLVKRSSCNRYPPSWPRHCHLATGSRLRCHWAKCFPPQTLHSQVSWSLLLTWRCRHEENPQNKLRMPRDGWRSVLGRRSSVDWGDREHRGRHLNHSWPKASRLCAPAAVSAESSAGPSQVKHLMGVKEIFMTEKPSHWDTLSGARRVAG